MKLRIAMAVLALALAGCDRQAVSPEGAPDEAALQLDAPAPESEPSRVFAPANDAARTATGQLIVAMSLRLPDAAGADAQEVLTLTGEGERMVEAQITGAVSPATQVQGQTLRALLELPVEEPQVLVYRVTSNQRPDGAQGLCGAEAADYVVVWEPSGPGDPVMKLIGVMGGQPGASSARACPMLEYRRA
ncbi:MAG: hypothetical protein R3C16_11280 [Hyphomonadaceae bacterium]